MCCRRRSLNSDHSLNQVVVLIDLLFKLINPVVGEFATRHDSSQ
nr:hypothetical protein [Prevotella sp.]